MNRFVSPAMFARSAGESRYPQLWNGRVGVWCPALGPTGDTLRDWSGRADHGTLTSLTLGNAWNVGDGYHRLTLDGTGYVTAPHGDHLNASVITLFAWIKPVSATEDGYVFAKNSDGGLGGWAMYWEGSTDRIQFIGQTFAPYSSAVFTDSGLVLISLTCDATTVRFYRNGVPAGSTPADVPTNAVAVTIGNRTGGSSAGAIFNGSIYEAGIYNRVLSESEMCLLNSVGPGGSFAMRERRRVRSAAGGMLLQRRRMCA